MDERQSTRETADQPTILNDSSTAEPLAAQRDASVEITTQDMTHTPAASQRPPHSHNLPARKTGSIWEWLGFLLLVIGGVMWPIARSNLSNIDPRWAILLLILVILGLVYGRKLYNRGRQYHAMGGLERIAGDPRPPVLYLRSFQDDSTTEDVPLVNPTNPLSTTTTEEEQLAALMNEIGPFIAIGEPRENLPDLGAVRMYVGDDEWQATVEDLMQRARLVVLRAGATEGLWWEVQRATKLVQPQRLLIVIPFDQHTYDAFKLKAQPYFPRPIPDYREPQQSWWRKLLFADFRSIRGFLYFQPDWTAQYIAMQQAPFGTAGDEHPLLPSLRATLQPVFGQLDLPVRAIESGWKRWGLWFGKLLLYIAIGIAMLSVLRPQ